MKQNEKLQTILIVDDQPANLEVLSHTLLDAGFNVAVAIDGESALQQVEYKQPELILLDVLMPGIDGFETCRRLKENPLTNQIPVIFMTVTHETVDKVKGFSLGAVDYITKPFEQKEILARVRTHLQLHSLKKRLSKQNEHLQQELRLRKRVEQRLQQLNQELSRSNQELEQFAYVTSHDLQQPLRTIENFTQLLAQSYSDQLDGDEEAEQIISFVLNGVSRMKALINDLLTYSRITTQRKELQSADCEVILEIVTSNLELLIRETDTTITSGSLPTVKANQQQLVQLFQNLIDNAIKYRRQQPPAIKIGAKAKNGEWLFWVKDNGIGISSEHNERIFLIFQRLHTSKEYPGTGIGLAICQKIVQLHHGKIWLDSELGQGTTFYFTIREKPSLLT